MKKWLSASFAALALAAHTSAQEPEVLAQFDGGIGVTPVANVAQEIDPQTATFANVVQNVVRGIRPAGPWRITDLKAIILRDGRISVRGKGLLLAGGNRIGQNAGQSVFATLICEVNGPFAEHSTNLQGVPLDPNGNFQIDDTLSSVPVECASPVFLIRSANLPDKNWFAAGILRQAAVQ